VAVKKGTRRGSGPAPGSAGEREGARGEGTCRGMQDRFRGRSSNLRTPGVRYCVGTQSGVARSQQEEDNGEGPCWFG
jgi:hypothetical protein